MGGLGGGGALCGGEEGGFGCLILTSLAFSLEARASFCFGQEGLRVWCSFELQFTQHTVRTVHSRCVCSLLAQLEHLLPVKVQRRVGWASIL